MKTREIIEHLEKHEELIDDVDYLNISIDRLGCGGIEIFCSRFEQGTKDLFRHNADRVEIEDWSENNILHISLDIEGVKYFTLLDSEKELNSILKGE